MKKRLIATMLCLIMLFSVVPSMAYELRYKDKHRVVCYKTNLNT